jgi:hypothetical protein
MKITQKQLHMLYQIAVASANIVNGLAYDQETRQKLINEILNQQDNEIFLEIK